MQDLTDFQAPLLNLKEKLRRNETTAASSEELKDSKGLTQSNESPKKMVFRFKKSELKRALPESLVFEVEKDSEASKEKRIKKQLDDVRNQLEGISFTEKTIEPSQKQPMGLSESERDEKVADFETKYILKATTVEELRELTGNNEKAYNAHFKTLMFNQNLKKKREEALYERRKKITIIDVKCNQTGEIVLYNNEAFARDFDEDKTSDDDDYSYYAIEASYNNDVQLIRKEKLYLNPVVYDIIEKNIPAVTENKKRGEMQILEPEDEYDNYNQGHYENFVRTDFEDPDGEVYNYSTDREEHTGELHAEDEEFKPRNENEMFEENFYMHHQPMRRSSVGRNPKYMDAEKINMFSETDF